MKTKKIILSTLLLSSSHLLFASPDRLPEPIHTPFENLVTVLMAIVGVVLGAAFIWYFLKNKVEGKKSDSGDKTALWLSVLLIGAVVLWAVTKCS